MDRTPAQDAANAVLSHLPALVRLDDAANALHVTERTVRRWVELGKLTAYRTAPRGSGRVLFARAELARFLATLAEPATSASVTDSSTDAQTSAVR